MVFSWAPDYTQYINPHTHIWTYAAGSSTDTGIISRNCPCNTGNTYQSPPFIYTWQDLGTEENY